MKKAIDHCRIGSLEKNMFRQKQQGHDHCRIGSLEISLFTFVTKIIDHCRIGSLETLFTFVTKIIIRSLPHRQLRKYDIIEHLLTD